MVSQTFRCNACRAPFNRKGDLQRHERIHSGDRPHACSMCTKRFTQASGLKTHMNTHTGEKPFQCEWDHCLQKFSDPSSRGRHYKEVHLRLPHFQCPKCSTAIKRRSAFRVHLQTKHHCYPTDREVDAMGGREEKVVRRRRRRANTTTQVKELCHPSASSAQFQPDSQSSDVDMITYNNFHYDNAFGNFNHHALFNPMTLSRPSSRTPSLSFSHSPSPVPSCYASPNMITTTLPEDMYGLNFGSGLKEEMMFSSSQINIPHDGWSNLYNGALGF